MWPLIRRDDHVRVVSIDLRLRLGDVVLVETADRWVIHRARRLGACVTTKGDSSPRFDSPIERNRIAGRVAAVRRGNTWYRLPPYPLSLVLAAAAILMVPLRTPLGPLVRTLRGSMRLNLFL